MRNSQLPKEDGSNIEALGAFPLQNQKETKSQIAHFIGIFGQGGDVPLSLPIQPPGRPEPIPLGTLGLIRRQ